jgi:hypothetical protein
MALEAIRHNLVAIWNTGQRPIIKDK